MSVLKQNLYNVKLKIGKRSWTQKIYAKTPDNILSFCNTYLQAKVIQISKIVYEASESSSIPVDDPLTYQNTLYFMMSNNEHSKMNQTILQTVKTTKSYNEVIQGLIQYIMIDDTSDIKENIVVSESSK